MANPTLDAWAHHRQVPLPLPSGAGEVVVDTLDLTQAIAQDTLPNPLAGIAIQVESGKLDRAEMSKEDLQSFFELQCHVVAHAVIEMRPKDGGEPITGPLDVAWVADSMPVDDRQKIWNVATHVVTYDELLSMLSLGPFREGEERSEAPGDGGADRQDP